MIPDKIKKTIANFYPKNINCYAEAYDLAPETIHHNFFLKKINDDNNLRWESLKKTFPKDLYLLDYTRLPAFNTCYELNFSYRLNDGLQYYVVYYLSALYPAYCFLTLDFINNSNHLYSQIPTGLENLLGSINNNIEKYFEGYQLMPSNILDQIVPDYYIQTGSSEKGKIFNYLFETDPRFNKYL